MTKAELIRKMSKRYGVPDSEAKIFFEIFLKRISVMLKPGEALKINTFGYFQFRKAVVQSMLSTTADKISTDYSDLIVFSPLIEDTEENSENLIFNIPAYLIEDENYNQLDSFFSISIGKPVIPLKGINDTEYFVPPTSGELRKLIETKVEKILEGAEIITKHTKGNEYLIIKPELNDNSQFELPWDNKTGKEEDSKEDGKIDDKKNNQPTSFNHIAWDFGEDLSRQLEEESILDVGVEQHTDTRQNKDENPEDVSWDFGAGIKDEEVIDEAIEEVKNYNIQKNNIEDNFTGKEITGNKPKEETKENIPGTTGQQDRFTTKEFEERVAEDLEKYQRVKAITREFTNEPAEEETKDDVEWDFGREDKTDFDEIENMINNFDDKQKNDLYKTFTGDEVSLEEKNIDELYKEKNENETAIEKDTKGNTTSAFTNKYRIGGKDYLTNTKTKNYSYAKRNTSTVFFIALGTILAVGAVLFIYLKNVNINILNTKRDAGGKVIQASSPEVINRTYDIPVTYPYLKSDREVAPVQSGIDKDVLNSPTKAAENMPVVEKSNLSTLLNNSNEPKSNTTVKKEPKNKTTPTSSNAKVKGNIYQNGNFYVVQVSSWRTKSIAERQVNRFKSAGYNAFLEKAEIPGRGVWYRVKVGNFNSLIEAENFSKRFK